MNDLTQKIKVKGYLLPEACKKLGISLRTYRRWESKDHDHHEMLVRLIREMESKNV